MSMSNAGWFSIAIVYRWLRACSRPLGMGCLALVIAVPVSADDSTSPEALRARAEAYWQAKELNDLQSIYAMEAAGLPGGWLTPDTLFVGWPVKNAKVLAVEVDGDQATVEVSVDMAIGILPAKKHKIEDGWVLVEGTWYHKTFRPTGPRTSGKVLESYREKERAKRAEAAKAAEAAGFGVGTSNTDKAGAEQAESKAAGGSTAEAKPSTEQ